MESKRISSPFPTLFQSLSFLFIHVDSMSSNRPYNPLYATTTADCVGYNERNGDNTIYETFRDIYANPSKPVNPKELVEEAKQRVREYREELRETNRLNLADNSRSGQRTQTLLSTQVHDPHEELQEQQQLQQQFLRTHPSTNYKQESEPTEAEYQRANRCVYAETSGNLSISRRLPSHAINKHVPVRTNWFCLYILYIYSFYLNSFI